ncbi:MAG: GAF domain-containing protein, partial [Anaerolineae bacterium]
GSIGAAAAHRAMRRTGLFSDEESYVLSAVYSDILASLRVSPDELRQRVDYYQDREALLSRQAGELEAMVAERTRDLEVATQVARATTLILDPDRLIREVVDLIREQFGLYYVGLFLVDEARQWAVLHAGTGSAGRAMLERGHRIQVGEGMVGWSIAHGEWRVAAEAGQDAVRLATPELPETRSEAALPLRSREQVLGALTVQDTEPEAFDENRLVILQLVTDQVGVALDNARLFTESQNALEAQRRAYGEVSSNAWLQMARTRPDWGYYSDHRGVARSTGEWQPWMDQAIDEDRTVVMFSEDASVVAIPVRVRGNVVGALDFSKAGSDPAWTEEEVRLLETLTDQLGIALESAQLYADTRMRAARERLLGEVTTRVRETLDLETVMRTAAVQIREALNLPEVAVRLRPSEPISEIESELGRAHGNGGGEQ